MANNRIAYGLAKKFGIDTTGKSPGEVWELLKKHGVTEENAEGELKKQSEEKTEKLIDKYSDSPEEDKESSGIGAKKIRRVNKVIETLKTYEGKSEGTYDYHTGKQVNLTDGYMVTFHQNEADEQGHYKSHYGRYTDEEYDKLSNEFAAENNAEIYIGVFDNEPEISFKINNFSQAKKLAKIYNQKSTWNNKKQKEWKNPFYNHKKNPMRGD